MIEEAALVIMRAVWVWLGFGYVTPPGKLEGCDLQASAECDRKLEEAPRRRQLPLRQVLRNLLSKLLVMSGGSPALGPN